MEDIKVFNILSNDILNVPGIYRIVNDINGKCYVGSAINIKLRILRHLTYLKHNYHHSPKLLRSVNKYGLDNFSVEILFVFTLDYTALEMLEKEDYYINLYNSIKEGYNILDAKAHIGSFKLSLELINKAVAPKKKVVFSIDRFTGIKEKEFESITDAANYYKTSTSNISRVCNGTLRYIKDKVFVYEKDYDVNKNYITQNIFKGVPKPEAQRLKMRLHSSKNKKVFKYDVSYNLILEYISRAECERSNNMKKEYLRCRMDRNLDGFIYSFKEIKDIV